MGINKSLKTAQEIVMRRKRRSYQRINNSIKKSTFMNIANSGLYGSLSENQSRTIFEYKLSEYFNANEYEYIVGLNSNNIIP